MITIKSEGQGVILSFDLPNYGAKINFQINRNESLNARLLSDEMNRTLERRMEAIREAAYNQGWKDAKGKKVAKAKWFSSRIDTI